MTEITNVDSAQVEEAKTQSTDIVVRAEQLTVNSTADCEIASAIVAGGTALLAHIDSLFKKPTKKAYEAHKSIKGLWNEMRDPVAGAITSAKKKVGGYHDQLRADADAARALEAKRLAKQEEDRRLAAAVALESRGETEKAEELVDAPAPPTPRPLITAPPPPKVAGLSPQIQYTGVVKNLPAFIQWTLDTLAFSEYFNLKQTVLDRVVQKAKGKVDIPGVEILSQTMVKSRKI